MYRFLFFFPFFSFLFAAQELPFLYHKNYINPASSYEEEIVNHVKKSLEDALHLKSKLNGTNFSSDRELNIWKSEVPSDHLLNNLCNWKGASHLHIGLLKGGSFVAALYGNQDLLNEKIGLDWFLEYPIAQFMSNCSSYLNLENCKIVNGNCFAIDKSLFTAPVDIYFYDADHSLTGHQLAFTYYDPVFSDIFVAVVDDWACPWVRRPTFKAFEILNYQLLYEAVIPADCSFGHGQYIVVIKKS